MGATNLPPRAQLQLLAPPPPAPGLLGSAPPPAADWPGGTAWTWTRKMRGRGRQLPPLNSSP
eukprot:467552-Rhodomonas_salina.1